LHEKGCPWDYTIYSEVLSGDLTSKKIPKVLEILNFAYDHGWSKDGDDENSPSPSLMWSRDMELLKWYYEHEFDLECDDAAAAGFLEGLKFLREKGVTWWEGTCKQCIEKGYTDENLLSRFETFFQKI
jgi:hypothetical protein